MSQHVFYVMDTQCSEGYFGPQDRAKRDAVIQSIGINTPSTKWEDLRYDMEYEMGMHPRKFIKSLSYAYLDGYLYDPHKPLDRIALRSGDAVREGSCVILSRKCSAYKPYVPLRYRITQTSSGGVTTTTEPPSATWNEMSEDERISSIQGQSLPARPHIRTRRYEPEHPSDIIRRLGRQPPDSYICRKCNCRGHWKEVCPTDGPRRVAHGIPWRDLKPAVTPDELKRAMINPRDPSQLVCLKNK